MGGVAAAVTTIGGAIMGGVKAIAGPLIGGAVTALTNLFSDNSGGEKISRMPAYNEQEATMEQTKLVDQILSQERAKRKDDIAGFDERIAEAKIKLLEQLRQDIEQFQRYGLNMDYSIFEDQFNLINNSETLADLANRRLTISDSECARILSIENGDKRSQEFTRYEKQILLEGTDNYFATLEQTYTVAFKFIEDNVRQQSERLTKENSARMQEIAQFVGNKKEKEKYRKEIQAKLRDLKELESLC